MEGEGGVSRSIITELHSSDIQRDEIEGEIKVLLEVSSMNLILGMSQEIKSKSKVVLLEVSLMNFFLWIPKEIKWKVKAWCFSK